MYFREIQIGYVTKNDFKVTNRIGESVLFNIFEASNMNPFSLHDEFLYSKIVFFKIIADKTN